MSENYVEDFIAYIDGEKRLSALSVEAYERDLLDWQECTLKLKEEGAFSEEDFQKALLKLQERNLAATTLERKRMALRAYIKYRSFMDEKWGGLLEWVPATRTREVLPKALSIEELQDFLEAEDPKQSSEELRDRALLELLYASALRVSELISLTWQDVNEQEMILTVRGKGAKERFVPFSERSYGFLKRYKEKVWPLWTPRKSPSERVFLSKRKKALTRMAVWKIVQRRALRAGLEGVHPHVLRHSCASHLLQGGGDLRFVQCFLGHASINTTEHYLKIQDQDLQKLFEEFHPLG